MRKTIKILLFVVILAGFISCERNENEKQAFCDSDNPIEDIGWLKEKKSVLESNDMPSQIIRYKYNGEYVFLIDPCFQCPDGLTSVFDCAGNVICAFGGIDGRNTCPDFEAEANDSTMLFDNVQ